MDQFSIKILIVEDEALIASGISYCLEELGHQTLGIMSTANEAISVIENEKPDLILMDINLPGIDGITAMEQINQSNNIPCIFITGYSDQSTINRAESTASYGYLVKPVDLNDLRAAIQIAMARYREHQNVSKSLQLTKQALEDRKLIERAKGILMDSFELKESQAMHYMQKKSRDTNKQLVVVAREIIDLEKRLHK